MQFLQSNVTSRVKALNQSSVLKMIYFYGPIKRSDIAEQLGLTMPTITTNVNSLIGAGLVQEEQNPCPDNNRGRKARPVDIIPDAQHYVGIEMRGSRRVICVQNFRGQILYTAKDDTPCRDYEKNMELSCAMLHEALEHCRLTLEDVAGIGFCTPGLVNGQEGILDTWPSYGWLNKNIRADLAALTGYTGPISVENNACVRAYGARLEQRKMLNEVPNFAYFFVSYGIACPFFLNTANVVGSVVGAGEVGHMIMEPNGLPCSCGNRGCLEAYASNTAVIAQCSQALAEGGAPILRSLCPEGADPTMEQILSAQASGDEVVCRILDGAVYRIGIAIANIINFSCPRIMFVDGALFGAVKNQETLREIVNRNLCNVIHTDTEFIFVRSHDFSGAAGAASLAIYNSLDNYTE